MEISNDKELRALDQEKDRILKLIEEVKRRSEDEKVLEEEALSFIQCDEPSKYRKKIVGFAAPFNMTEKDERIKRDDKGLKYRYKTKEDKKAIKDKVNEIKTKRAELKDKEKTDKQEQYVKHRNYMKNLHLKLLRQKDGGEGGPIPAYPIRDSNEIFDVSQSKPIQKVSTNEAKQAYGGNNPSKAKAIPPPSKFTLETLGQLRYEDLAGAGSDGFNPKDVLDEDDDQSEDSILRRYRDEEEAKNKALGKQIQQPVAKPPRNLAKQLQSVQYEQEQPLENVKSKHHKKGALNNSISNPGNQLVPKTNAAQGLNLKALNPSKQNLLLKSHEVPMKALKRKMEPATDIEKIVKNK